MKCCICNESIEVERNGWSKGHNAEPIITDGRCCGSCNASVVIPARMATIMGVDSIFAVTITPDEEEKEDRNDN